MTPEQEIKYIRAYKTEYITIRGFPQLIGKRARFKDNLAGYTARCWGKTGTIKQLHQVKDGDLNHVGLSLVFDVPIDKGGPWEMDSCYIKLGSFELLD